MRKKYVKRVAEVLVPFTQNIYLLKNNLCVFISQVKRYIKGITMIPVKDNVNGKPTTDENTRITEIIKEGELIKHTRVLGINYTKFNTKKMIKLLNNKKFTFECMKLLLILGDIARRYKNSNIIRIKDCIIRINYNEINEKYPNILTKTSFYRALNALIDDDIDILTPTKEKFVFYFNWTYFFCGDIEDTYDRFYAERNETYTYADTPTNYVPGYDSPQDEKDNADAKETPEDDEI